ncbi:MAG: hypothetical protein DRO40_13620 [Thermoprotei archaeon]|nr:MAG: hypothetical protein DRO40_13620 [Thermoprotei archaeon]
MSWYPGKLLKRIFSKKERVFGQYRSDVWTARIADDVYNLKFYAGNLSRMMESWWLNKKVYVDAMPTVEKWIEMINKYFEDLKEAVEAAKKPTY